MTTSVTCRVEVGLLGPFTLRVGGRQVRSDVWKSKKALTLLKYLASIHGRRVSSDALIELLWPDQINVDIQRNLHTAIWFARRILLPEESPTAESPLRYSHGSYWLDLGGTCIDVALFESHATRSNVMVHAYQWHSAQGYEIQRMLAQGKYNVKMKIMRRIMIHLC